VYHDSLRQEALNFDDSRKIFIYCVVHTLALISYRKLQKFLPSKFMVCIWYLAHYSIAAGSGHLISWFIQVTFVQVRWVSR